MRLSSNDIKIIKEITVNFDENAKIFLFGSRIDDSKRGGDIDLLLISEILNLEDKLSILIELKSKLGDQKIDLLIKTKESFANDSFCQSLLLKAL